MACARNAFGHCRPTSDFNVSLYTPLPYVTHYLRRVKIIQHFFCNKLLLFLMSNEASTSIISPIKKNPYEKVSVLFKIQN